jgi:hypothetical protein
MISIELARSLRDAGLRWTPRRGDHFVVADRDMDDEVFVLSDMTIEIQQFATGPVIGFNGTTEWAMDDVEQDEAIWLPREDQLRALLGGTFRGLTRTHGGYAVEIALGDEPLVFEADEAEPAYGAALLHLIQRGTG